MKTFINTINGVVPLKWIDGNGHMNVAYYMQVFDQSMLSFLDKINIDDENLTMVASRVNMSYRKELLEGDEFHVLVGIANIGTRSMSISQKLICNNATCAILAVSFSIVERCSVTIEKDIALRAKEYIVSELRDPFESILTKGEVS